jgi:hypothetical protein
VFLDDLVALVGGDLAISADTASAGQEGWAGRP